MIDNNEIALLTLLKFAIKADEARSLAIEVDWGVVKSMAEKQGLSAVVMDGIACLPAQQKPSKRLMLKWIGEVLHNYEYRYRAYKQALAELAGFYNSHGYRMMLLKGYSCGLDWPNPTHRPYGDIDIWQFGLQRDADTILSVENIIKVDSSHHQHTVFEWRGFVVENHYDFVNVYTHKSSADLEKIFKKLGTDDSYSVVIEGEKVYLPSPNLNALFLIRHMVGHFAAAEITLRQVLDWAFFVRKHTKEIDWEWLIDLLEKYHMKVFFNLINAICVEDLGFPLDIFPTIQYVPELKGRVLEDILHPEYTAAEPKGLLSRVLYKYKRWQGNAWKQEMCYGESRWSAFWTGIWAKLLKPASI